MFAGTWGADTVRRAYSYGRSHLWEVFGKDFGDGRKSYKELSYKDVQGSVESVYSRWGYLGKRRWSEENIPTVICVSIVRISGTSFILRGVEL